MSRESRNLPRLMAVARALGHWRERVVFVGGAVVNLYSTHAAAPPEPRVTDDVNCVVEVAPRAAFYQLEDELRQLGFVNDTKSGVICRWQYQSLTVDIMPTDPAILGFGNLWYAAGIAEAITYRLPDDTFIRLLPATYYLATKLTALRDRGWADLRVSQDLEDIVHLVANRPELAAEVAKANQEVRDYVRQQFQQLLRHPAMPEALAYMLPYGADEDYQQAIHQQLRKLAAG